MATGVETRMGRCDMTDGDYYEIITALKKIEQELVRIRTKQWDGIEALFLGFILICISRCSAP